MTKVGIDFWSEFSNLPHFLSEIQAIFDKHFSVKLKNISILFTLWKEVILCARGLISKVSTRAIEYIKKNIAKRTFDDFSLLVKQMRWQGWRCCESTCLPPMWPGFDFRTRCQMWFEFVGPPISERFFPGYYGFPLSSKTNIWFELIWFVNNNCKIVIWAMLIWFPLEL